MRVESASADGKAAEECLETLDMLVMEENYLPKQVIQYAWNLCILEMEAERVFIHEKAKCILDSRAFKERITALLGDNVAGYTLKRCDLA